MTHIPSLKIKLFHGLFLALLLSLGACNKETIIPEEEAVLNEQEVTALLEGALAAGTQTCRPGRYGSRHKSIKIRINLRNPRLKPRISPGANHGDIGICTVLL